MRLQTKAFYNLLRLNAKHDATFHVEPWQIEDLQLVEENILFSRLSKLGISFTKEHFFAYAATIESPEDLADLLLQECESSHVDEIYLILFELWKRLLPDTSSLSIFCDHLDTQIDAYAEGALDSDETLQDALADLEDILDTNTEIGADPNQVFQSISEYIAHDVESFLYDYITEQIDTGYELYAYELLEGFYPYMNDLKWFDFLRLQLASSAIEVNQLIALILRELEEIPDLDLQIELLDFMVTVGDRRFFIELLQKTLQLLQKEEDFQQILEIAADYYLRLDEDKMESAIAKIMHRRSDHSPIAPLSSKDPDVKKFTKLVKLL